MLPHFGGAGLLDIPTVISENLKGLRPSGAEYQPFKVYHDQASLTQFGGKVCDVSRQPLTSHCCYPLVCAASCDVIGCLNTSQTLPPPYMAVGGRKHGFQAYFKALRGVVGTSNFQGFLFKYLANQRCKETNTIG